MELNFQAAIDALGGQTAMFRIANEARPASDYLFATLLPERNLPSYFVEAGSMTIRPTLAGLAAMDSPYPPGGLVEVSTFLERTAKIANHVPLSEKSLRELQDFLLRAAGQQQDTNGLIQGEVLNFYNKVILQAHMDTMEYLRGQALCFGAINWTYNQKSLVVDYGIPATHILTQRTIAGNTAYGGSSSSFWTDHREAQRLLRYNVRAVLMHTDMFNAIVSNTANAVQVIAQDGNVFTLQQTRVIGGNTVPSPDQRDRVTIITYALEGEVLDPANPGETIRVPFMERTRVVWVGAGGVSGYRVGQGATDDPNEQLAVGYSHIAPTVEGGGRAGRWGRVFTPQDKPWMIVGEGVTNGLPVIENEKAIVIGRSELA